MVKMDKLLFGTAGIPLSTETKTTENGILRVSELGLSAMELEFVRGVRMTYEKSAKVKKIAMENDIVLTAHGPYFINLNAKDDKKQAASMKRILDTARVTHRCGGYSITFHAGYYLNKRPEDVYRVIKNQLENIVSILKSENIKIWIRPETTGKPTQFGSFHEIIALSQELDMVMPVIDFAHLHARTGGRFNSRDKFRDIFITLEKELGKDALKNMHVHVAGVEYTEKGERRHLNLEESDLRYRVLMAVMKEFNCCGVVISESPNIESDAILMKKIYESI